jgi:hypothetical protein
MGSSSTLSKGEKKAYKKLSKLFSKNIKDVKKRIASQEKALKKHGVTDIATWCGTSPYAHTDALTSSLKSEKAHAPTQHKLAATPKDSQED